MGKKHDRIAAKAAKTVKERRKKDGVATETAAPAAESTSVFPNPEPESKPEPVAKVAKERKVKPVVEGALPAMPKLPSSAKARKPKPEVGCACGCGTLTRSMWAPGHDARAKGWALRIQRNVLTMDDVPENERAGARHMLAVLKAGPAKADIKLVKSEQAEPESAESDVAVNE